MDMSNSPSLFEVYKYLKNKTWVDLTHAFAPGIPHWHGLPDEQREELYHYDEGVGTLGSGYYVHNYSHVGQWGTHADPPAHFVKGLRTLDQINVKEMILPLVVIDIHAKVANNSDYIVKLEDVNAWETRHGKIPPGCFVALRTDWSKRWPDSAKMQNEDALGIKHYPGWSLDVLKFLFEKRQIMVCGHETTDTDSGLDCSRDNYSLEAYVLSTNHYQVEMLTNLDMLPEYGALVVSTFPKPKNGSGFPARVFAILP